MNFEAQLTFGLFMGFIFGVINSWSKKAFLVLLFIMSLIIITAFITIEGFGSAIVYTIDDWGSVIGYLIGYFSGRFTYDEANKRNNKRDN